MRLIAPLLVLASAAAAADLRPDTTMRLSADMLPTKTAFTITASGPGGTASLSDGGNWDSNGRVSGGLYWSNGQPATLYVGMGLAGSGASFQRGGVTETIGEFGVFIEPGVKFSDGKLALELGLPLGVGFAAYDETGPGYSIRASGAYTEIGLVVRPVITVNRMVLFAEGGYLVNTANLNETAVTGVPGVTVSGSIKTSGAFFGIGVGVRL